MRVQFLSFLLVVCSAWTNTPTYIAARIAELDLIANDYNAYNKTLAMLSPLNDLTFSGSYPFLDAAVYTEEASRAGYSLTDNWVYQFTPYFDGVPAKDIEQHKEFDMLKSIQGWQSAVDYNGGSRIDSTFGKSYCLRYIFNLVINLHQPMHNIIRVSTAHPDGDDFGKLHKIDHDGYSNLFDIFEDAFGLFPPLSYPLESTDVLDSYALQIMAEHPRSELLLEAKNTVKKKWSSESFTIAKNYGYVLQEENCPSAVFMHNGKEIVKKQLALAGYRLSNLISYMMSMQRGDVKINNQKYKRQSKGM